MGQQDLHRQTQEQAQKRGASNVNSNTNIERNNVTGGSTSSEDKVTHIRGATMGSGTRASNGDVDVEHGIVKIDVLHEREGAETATTVSLASKNENDHKTMASIGKNPTPKLNKTASDPWLQSMHYVSSAPDCDGDGEMSISPRGQSP